MTMTPRYTLLALAIGLAVSTTAPARPYEQGPYAVGCARGAAPPPCVQPGPAPDCAAPGRAATGPWRGPRGGYACASGWQGGPAPLAGGQGARRSARHGACSSPPRQAASRLERMAARLDLSEAQQAEIAAIIEETRAERDALREATQERIAAVLTPEQRERLPDRDEDRGRSAPSPRPEAPAATEAAAQGQGGDS